MIIQFEDPDEQRLAALLRTQGPITMERRYIQRILARSGNPSLTEEVDLAVLRNAIEEEAIRFATKHPSAEWLWLLRRVPPFYLSWLDTDAKLALGYLRMAEAVTNMRTRWRDNRSRAHKPNYRAGPTNARHLTQLLLRIRLLHFVSGELEMKGRLAPLRTLLESLDRLQDRDKLDEASRIYFARKGSGDDNPLAGAASFASVGSDVLSEQGTLQRPLLVLSAFPWKFVHYEADTLAPTGSYLTRFMPQVAKPEGRLHELLRTSQESISRDEATALFALLVGLDPTVVQNLVSVAVFGYLLVRKEHLRQVIDEGLRELDSTFTNFQMTPDAALELVKQIVPSLWPLRPGTALRPYGPDIMVDLAGAREALFNRLSRTARIPSEIQGSSTAFELDIQSLFRGTRWEPPVALAQLRGRSLKHNGKTITDIDALGIDEGVLLLVSAKAWPRRPGVDTGEFTDIQNIMRDVGDKLDEWKTHVEYLREHPRGDNYDFSSASRIIGVLCLPFLPFVEAGPLTEMPLPGLYAVTSIDELLAWLR